MRSPRQWSLVTLLVLVLATVAPLHVSAKADCIAAPCVAKGTLLVVGDSLTVGADSFGKVGDKLVALNNWSRVRVDAAIGRRIPRGIEIVTAQMKANPRTSGFVVALGTNDLLSRRTSSYHATNIESLLKAAKGKPVLWVNVTYSVKIHADYVERAKLFNGELVKLTKKYRNLTIASWYSHFSTTSPYWSVRDGIHLTPSGYRDRARFIAATAATWWRKVTAPPTTTTTTTTTTVPPDTVPPIENPTP